MDHVIVLFDLPFLLRVEDSLVDQLPENYDDYFVIINDAEIMLRFKKNTREINGFHIGTEDIRGQLSYSSVMVGFNEQYFNNVGITDTFRGFEITIWETALEAVNQFLEIYRRETNSSWINRIITADIYNYYIRAIQNGKMIDQYHKGSLGNGKSLGNLVTVEEDQAIRSKLSNSWKADDLERLAFLPEHQLLMEDYWASTLSIGIYCEAFLSTIIRASYSKLGLTEEEIDLKFIKPNSGGVPFSFTKFLKNSVNELCYQNVNNPNSEIYQYFDAWCKDTRDIRNLLAHGKKMTVSKEVSLKAMTSGKALMNYLKEQLS